MKILVINDTQSEIEKAIQTYKDVPGIEAVIYTGNNPEYAAAIEETLGCSVISVGGREATVVTIGEANKPKAKVQGGFIRDLLNNSDRF